MAGDFITDPQEVARLAEERAEENWSFRSFLKGIDLAVADLDALVHRHAEAVSSQIDCTECANCCREAKPLLHPADVTRLASGLDLSEAELTKRYLVSAEEADTLTFNQSPCPLLSGNLCSVYEHRPDDCRSFPHLHKEEFVFRLLQAVENCAVCPIVFNVMERLKDELCHGHDDEWE